MCFPFKDTTGTCAKRRAAIKGQGHGFGFGTVYVAEHTLLHRTPLGPTWVYLDRAWSWYWKRATPGNNIHADEMDMLRPAVLVTQNNTVLLATPKEKEGGKSASPTPTFHVTEGQQAEGLLAWLGIGADEDADGPLAAVCQDLATVPDNRTHTTSVNEEPQSDPLPVRDPWARGPQREPLPQRQSSSSSSRSSWAPVSANALPNTGSSQHGASATQRSSSIGA